MSNQIDYSNANGISLATAIAGVAAAVLFLLISSYVSQDANWTNTSHGAWVTTGWTGDELQARKAASKPATLEKKQRIKTPSVNDEAAHFSGALYGADFMRSFAKPT